MPFPAFTLVLGGASSGKSAWAERLVLSSQKSPVYLATAQAFDDEMTGKITKHQHRRGPEWQLMEAPLSVAPLLGSFTSSHIILLDCLTLWLSNQLMAEADIDSEITALLAAILACPAPVVCVSNELGLGLVPSTALGRSFRDWQGQLNQRFAAAADCVAFIAAGLPLPLKGPLPEVPA